MRASDEKYGKTGEIFHIQFLFVDQKLDQAKSW
jgi:hypothetical protein